MSSLRNLALLISSLMLLLLILSLAVNVRFIFFSRASGALQKEFSIENSYLFISPLEAKANKLERIRLTVFVLTNEGKGLFGKAVELNKSAEIAVEQVQSQTDVYGRAQFDLLSEKAGAYSVEALVDGIKVGESINVIFN